MIKEKQITSEKQLRTTLTTLLSNLSTGKVEEKTAKQAVAIVNSIFAGVKVKMKYDQLRKKKDVKIISFMEN